MRYILVYLLILFGINFLWGYSFYSHYYITRYALRAFAINNMPLYKNSEKIAVLSGLIDDIKKVKKEEYYRHYIDWESYDVLRQNGLISYDEFLKVYGKDFISKNGAIPYAIIDEYSNIVSALKAKKFQKAVLHMGFLSHYCGDIFQPLHLTKYYDGYTKAQKGIHSKFETDFADKLWQNLEGFSATPKYIHNLPEILFYIINKNRTLIGYIYRHHGRLRKPDINDFTNDVNLTKKTLELFKGAINFYASLVYSAFVDSGIKRLPDDFNFDLVNGIRSIYTPEMFERISYTKVPLLNGLYIRSMYPAYLEAIFKSPVAEDYISFLPGSDYILESNLAELFCDYVRKNVLNDNGIVIYNIRGFRSFIPPGPIFRGDVRLVFVFNNRISVLKMKGSSIKSLLNKAVKNLKTSGGVFQQSGMSVIYSQDKDGRYYVKDVLYEGKPLMDNKYYFVATNAYLAKGGDGYTEFCDAISIKSLNLTDYELFCNMIYNKELNPGIDNRNIIE